MVALMTLFGTIFRYNHAIRAFTQRSTGANVFYYNSSYLLLMVFIMAISYGAQWYLSSTFGRFSKIRNARDLTGAEVARDILDANGLSDVHVEPVAGQLTDHYDPRTRTVRLSEPNYNSPSLSALAVAAHECGHAIQHKQGYALLNLRASMVPVTNIGSQFGPLLIILGIFINIPTIAWIGVIGLLAALAFHAVTLPVEFNASARALRILEGNGYLTVQENAGAKSVLTAAALTYVAGAIGALMTLLYYVSMLSGGRRSSD
jgi:uncharacterized protein